VARIRTIKPEFFTSADVVALSPLARLLFIGLWGVADREGRMKWRPGDFKLQILPGDACEVDDLCGEILERGLVVLYGDGLAHIPTFLDHQSINPRETASKLPPPGACATRADASNLDVNAQRGKEGNGREGNEKEEEAARAPEGAALAAWAEEDRAFDEWNIFAREHGAPSADFLNTNRRFRLRAILAICGGLEGWRLALAKALEAKFIRDKGGGFQRWFDLDFVLDEQKFTRLMEGRYDQRDGSSKGQSGLSAALTGLAD
jgi:hypothetical protein